jgi:hypothetical protein
MKRFVEFRRIGYIFAILSIFGLWLAGCAATINYSYDPVADFSIGKNYSWAGGPWTNRQDPLIEKNVRFFADQSLKERGFTLTTSKPDFMVAMSYELEYLDPYRVRTLNLFVYRGQGNELIWQGTSSGTIKADSASPDLANAVKQILANFPPKR